MPAIANLDEEECYLAAVLDDPSGIELAELTWVDEEQPDRCFRVWDFQWPLYHCTDVHQIDQMGRSLGKSLGIVMRAYAFPFHYPGAEMLITAPELNHLRPTTDKIENLFLGSRLGREMLPKVKGGGINHQPQFQARFINNARIMSRLPNRDGRGVKGCIQSSSLVLTRRGHVPAGDVVPGDEVWTHEQRWKPVLSNTRYTDVDGYEIVGGGHRGFTVSDNHRLLARTNLAGPKRKRALGRASFPIADEISSDHYLGSPTRFDPELLPALATVEMLWIAGRYVADGSLSAGRVWLTIGNHKLVEVKERLRQASLTASFHPKAAGNASTDVLINGAALGRWMETSFGRRAEGKHLPSWLLGAPEQHRRAFLDGYLAGDGHWESSKRRWEVGTASKALALDLRLLGQTLGYSCSYSWVDPKVTQICGAPLKNAPQRSHRVTFSENGIAIRDGNMAWQTVRRTTPVTGLTVQGLVVADDESFLAEGIFHHNQHPLVIEMDEGQDYPEAGWVEIIETMKSGSAGAQWRVHGVSRGARDTYYKMTMGENPDLPFHVHRYAAPHRPSWSDAERKAKIALYGGSEDNVDYRRNIFGEHGDVHNPLFVLARLMACFVAGTPVTTPTSKSGFTSIEEVRVGDQVGTAIGAGYVTAVHSSFRDTLVELRLDNGEHLYCTPEHPFATSDGWQSADRLQSGDVLWTWDRTLRGVHGLDSPVPPLLLQDLYGDLARSELSRIADRKADVLGVRVLPADLLPTQQGRAVLLPPLRESTAAAASPTDRAATVRGVPTGVRPPQGQSTFLLRQLPCGMGESDPSPGLLGARQSGTTRWSWGSALHPLASVGQRLASRVLGLTAGCGSRCGQLLPRSGSSAFQGLCRSRRPLPSSASEEGSRSSARRLVDLPRVASVALLHRGDPGFARLSGGADKVRVFDLTVSGHPSFAVGRSRVLVHNCVRINESAWASQYNDAIYCKIKINDELHRRSGLPIEAFLTDIPASHLGQEYASYWAGMDVGYTNDPTEILIWGQLARRGKPDLLRQLLRVQLLRISASDQADVVKAIFGFYGTRLRRWGMDKTGNGLPLFQFLRDDPAAKTVSARLAGYGFSEKLPVEFDDRDPTGREKPEDLVIERNVIDFASDELRKLVDSQTLELPYDLELLTEFQGQSVAVVKDMGSAAGIRRRYSGGSCHTMDAARMLIAAKQLEAIEKVLAKPRHGPVLDAFFG